VEQAQEFDEIGLEVALPGQKVEFFGIQLERAHVFDLALDFLCQRSQIHVGGAALEPVFDLRAGKLMQHCLHHREFVDVGVEKRLDDHCAGFSSVLPSKV